MSKDGVKFQNKETGEDVNLTLRELQDVARGKAYMLMQEVQSLQKDPLIVKRDIPVKFEMCYQALSEVFIIQERILSELVKICGEGEKKGLFSQFEEFSGALMDNAEDTKQGKSE